MKYPINSRIRAVLYLGLFLIVVLAVWPTEGGWGGRVIWISEYLKSSVNQSTAENSNRTAQNSDGEDLSCRTPTSPGLFRHHCRRTHDSCGWRR